MGKPKDRFEVVEKKGETRIKIISGGGHRIDRSGSGHVYWAWKDHNGKIHLDHPQRISALVKRRVAEMFTELERKRLGVA